MRIIKKDGHEEEFKKEKVYQSVYESCLNAHHEKKKASNIANKVIRDLMKHFKSKKLVKSHEVFKYIATLLEKYDEDAAFLYETHRDVS